MEINKQNRSVPNVVGLETNDHMLFGKTLGEFLHSGRRVKFYSQINDIMISGVRIQVYSKDWITVTLKDVPFGSFKVKRDRCGNDIVEILDPVKFQRGIVVKFTRG